jgi:hypothetical protein
MRIKGRKTRKLETAIRQKMSVDTSSAAKAASSFQEALANCEGSEAREVDEVRRQEPVMPTTAGTLRVGRAALQRLFAGAASRAWSFLQAKYKISTTKRLRVSETISLGEKRFVAILAVEGREFLIGGGVSGMSLLAQLGAAGIEMGAEARKIGDAGDAL